MEKYKKFTFPVQKIKRICIANAKYKKVGIASVKNCIPNGKNKKRFAFQVQRIKRICISKQENK